MINGAHIMIYSKDADADRAFFRDVLKLNNVDVGEGWLIFGLPPAEIGFHPAEENNVSEFYLMCDDIEEFCSNMKNQGVECSDVSDQGWGLVTNLSLPGGGILGVYQPRHSRPIS